MMQAKKAFVCGLLVAMGVCLGGRELVAQIRTYNNSQIYTMPDGVIVQSIRPEPSEVAESLEIKRWHIRATLPPGSDADSFRYGVEVQKGDAPLYPYGGELFVPDGSRTMDVTVVLRPETPNWNTAPSFSVWSSNNFPVRYDGLISSRKGFPNPFREKTIRIRQCPTISSHAEETAFSS